MVAPAWHIAPGTRINFLTFVREAPSRRYPGGTLVRCGVFRCMCGNEYTVPIFKWKYGRTKWCDQCPIYGPFRNQVPRVRTNKRTSLPEIGDRIGQLTLVEFIPSISLDGHGNPMPRGKFLCGKCNRHFEANIRDWRADRYYTCTTCLDKRRSTIRKVT